LAGGNGEKIMSLAFGVGAGPDLIGALSAPRGWEAGRRRGVASGLLARSLSSARLLTQRLLAALDHEQATFAKGRRRVATSRDEIEIRNEFDRAAERAGLTEDEQAVLSGENRDLSRVILSLEIIGAALDLGLAPAAAAAWLRDERPEEPFNHRSPLQLMADEGRLGVEITLLVLRARRRLAPH